MTHPTIKTQTYLYSPFVVCHPIFLAVKDHNLNTKQYLEIKVVYKDCKSKLLPVYRVFHTSQ